MVWTRSDTLELDDYYAVFESSCCATQPKSTSLFVWSMHEWLVEWRRKRSAYCCTKYEEMLSCTPPLILRSIMLPLEDWLRALDVLIPLILASLLSSLLLVTQPHHKTKTSHPCMYLVKHFTLSRTNKPALCTTKEPWKRYCCTCTWTAVLLIPLMYSSTAVLLLYGWREGHYSSCIATRFEVIYSTSTRTTKLLRTVVLLHTTRTLLQQYAV